MASSLLFFNNSYIRELVFGVVSKVSLLGSRIQIPVEGVGDENGVGESMLLNEQIDHRLVLAENEQLTGQIVHVVGEAERHGRHAARNVAKCVVVLVVIRLTRRLETRPGAVCVAVEAQFA